MHKCWEGEMGQKTYHKRKSSDTIRTVTAEVTWGRVRRQWEWVGQNQPHLQYLLARGEPALHRRRGGGAKHAAACAFQENSTWSLECLEQSMEHYLALICRLEPGVGWSWGYREHCSLPPGCALIGYVSRVYVVKLAVSGLGTSTRLQQYSSSRYIEYRHSMD